ncbi:MAG: ornithine cyclodeaminase family protein [Anaerolineales bacterium]
MMLIRVINSAELRQALPMREAVAAMKVAFGQLSAGRASMPLRGRIDLPAAAGVTLIMPALLHQSGDFALKLVSVFGKNPARGLPTIHALVIALDPETGAPMALLEGASLTALRTGAGSGAATDLLARPEARTLAIFGSGVQARTQFEAVCTVRQVEAAWVFSRSPDHAQAFATALGREPWAPPSISVADTPAAAVREADIICTATTSSTPVFDGHDLRPGTHINAIGGYTPAMQEVDGATVARALVVVDSREAALAEAGDLIIPIRQGLIAADAIHAELGELVNGTQVGRTNPEQVTLFKSVGVAVQDAIAAGRALARAEQLGLGQIIEL